MNPALVDVLDWVEEMREDLQTKLYHRSPPGPAPHFDWAACGTPAQHRKHVRYGIPICDACRAAESRRFADRWHAGGMAEKQRLRRESARDLERDFAQMVHTVNVQLNGARP